MIRFLIIVLIIIFNNIFFVPFGIEEISCPLWSQDKGITQEKREPFDYDYWSGILSEEQLDVAEEIYSLNLESNNVLIWLAFFESSFDPKDKAINQSENHYSVDRGLFQINSFYHPNVSDECAFDLECSARWTNEMILNGKGYLWTTWNKIKN